MGGTYVRGKLNLRPHIVIELKVTTIVCYKILIFLDNKIILL